MRLRSPGPAGPGGDRRGPSQRSPVFVPIAQRQPLEDLTWDRDGYVLWYKRLEVGVFKLPRVAPGAGSVELRASELAMLLDGIDMAKLKRVPRYERPPKICGTSQESVVA